MAFANEIIFLMVSLIILGMTVHAASLYEGAKEVRPSRALMATFLLANLGGHHRHVLRLVGTLLFVDGQHLGLGRFEQQCFDRAVVARAFDQPLGGEYRAALARERATVEEDAKVNLEIDMLARYVARMIGADAPEGK